jgi:hypothetical protein
LYNYELLLETYGRMDTSKHGIRAFLWGNFLESIRLQDWVEFVYVPKRRILVCVTLLKQKSQMRVVKCIKFCFAFSYSFFTY